MSADSFIPFSTPCIGGEEIDEVVDSLKSGWITSGVKVAKFERDFQEYLGDGVEAVAVNSATAGLHLALEAIGVGPGDEVITTTHTFTATAEVVRYLGADVVFVDIDATTLCLDLEQVKSAITPRTKAIIPVHFGGLAVDINALLDISKDYNLSVVEDAAHALPSTLFGQMVGTLGSDATIFSFYANKTITTGEGGMLVTRNPDIARRAKVMRLHGINRDAFDRYTSKAPSWYYEVVAPGYKYNMTDLAASIGIHQLRKANDFHVAREKIAKAYNEHFTGLSLRLPPGPLDGDVHSWHLYVIQLDRDVELSRSEFIEGLYRKGVGCSVHYIPLHQQPYWRDRYGLEETSFPVSQFVYERSVSLPIYPLMTEFDIERVALAVRDLVSPC